jgi:hypothetical protein
MRVIVSRRELLSGIFVSVVVIACVLTLPRVSARVVADLERERRELSGRKLPASVKHNELQNDIFTDSAGRNSPHISKRKDPLPMTIYGAVRRRNAIRAALACRLADIHVAAGDTQTPLAKTILLNSIALLTPDQLGSLSKVTIDFAAVFGFVLDIVRAKFPVLAVAIDLILDALGIVIPPAANSPNTQSVSEPAVAK